MSKRQRFEMSPSPPPCPVNLLSLPPEILTQIALISDLPTAKSLALVSKRCTEPAEHRIWQHVDLTLDPDAHWTYSRGYLDERVRAVEAEHNLQLVDRARKIQGYGDKRRLGLVRKLTLLPRGGVTHILMEMLAGVSANLRELEIHGRDMDRRGDTWRPDIHDMLDLRLRSRRLLFPALSHIRLNEHCFRCTGFIPLLCDLAPNLVGLDVTITQYFAVTDETFPSFANPSSLRKLRLCCLWGDGPEEVALALDIARVIQHSPLLRELSIRQDFDSGEEEVPESMVQLLGEHAGLQDLFWVNDMPTFPSRIEGAAGWFVSVRRLVIQVNFWTDIFDHLPSLPALEIIHAHRWQNIVPDEEDVDLFTVLRLSPPAGFFEPPAQPMPPNFAQRLRSCPRLCSIDIIDTSINEYDIHSFSRLDHLESTGPRIGRIRSIRRGEHEVVHARILMNATWDKRVKAIEGVAVHASLLGHIWFDHKDLSRLKETFPNLPLATYHNLPTTMGSRYP